jgi:cysteine desulfurase
MPHPKVVRTLVDAMTNYSANSGSLHQEGCIVAHEIARARQTIATFFGVTDRSVVFTSGATESNTIAIDESLRLWRQAYPKTVPHIVVSQVEHPSIMRHVARLAHEGYATYATVPVLATGAIDCTILKESITPLTALVSVQYVNSETGIIQDVAEVARIVRRYKKHRGTEMFFPLVHTDASQALFVLPTHMPALGVSFLTGNPAKWYGPKGIGLLVLDQMTASRLASTGHEYGIRSGTHATPLILATETLFGIGISDKEHKAMQACTDLCVAQLIQAVPDVVIHGVHRAPHIVSFTVPAFESEHLVLELDAVGFAVSAKSACLSMKDEDSYVLRALYGDTIDPLIGAIRVSVGTVTQPKDIHAFVKALVRILNRYQGVERIVVADPERT